MKITSFLCFMIISMGTLFAQDIDDRLLAKYTQEELQTMIETDVEQYNVLRYGLDNAVYIANYDSSKGGNFETISVDLDALPTYAEMGLDITEQNQYFKIEGKEKLLVVKSIALLKHEMKGQW